MNLAHERADLTQDLDGFRVDVQALRGIAVIAVVLYHAGRILPGGFVGVDAFFVISGFVIGRLLLKQLRANGTLSFSTFYARRAGRLLPALAITLTTVVLVAPLLAPLGALGTTTRTGIAAALFSANLYLYGATSTGYFDASAELNPLLHTWSLSVEEQFYFAIPPLILLGWVVAKRRSMSPERALTLLVAVVFVVSFVVSIGLSYGGTVGPFEGIRLAFFAPFTRAWEFLAGMVLIFVPVHRVPRWVAGAVRLVGAAVLVATCVLYSDTTRFPGVAAIVPVIATALLIHGGTLARTAVSHGVAWSPLVRAGDVSYSWYLWHWPAIVCAGAYWPNAGRTPLVAAAVLSLVPAVISYRYVETRLRGRLAESRRRTALVGAVCVVLPLVAAAAAQPVESSIERSEAISEFRSALALHADVTEGCSSTLPIDQRPDDTCRWTVPGATMDIVLVGDSNAGQFSQGFIDAAGMLPANLRIATSPGCPMADVGIRSRSIELSECRTFIDSVVRDIETTAPDVVVIATATDRYIGNDNYTLTDPSGRTADTDDERRAMFVEGLDRTIERLSATGTRVVVMGVVPKFLHWDPRGCSAAVILVDSERCATPPAPIADNTDLAVGISAQQSAVDSTGAEHWVINGTLCPGGTCLTLRDGQWWWRDGEHISVYASRQLAPVIADLAASDS